MKASAAAVNSKFWTTTTPAASGPAKQKRGRLPAFLRLRAGSAPRLDRAVDDFHLIADSPARRRWLGEHALGAVLVTDEDLVFLRRFRVLLDLIPGEAAAQGAQHGRNVLAAAAADLVTDHPADHRAADCAGAGSLSRYFNLAHVFDHRAFFADRSDLRRRRGNDGLVHRPGLGLDRMLFLGLLCGFGLRGRLGSRSATDRSRDPAENGCDSHEAEKCHRGCGDDDKGMILTYGLRFHIGLRLS